MNFSQCQCNKVTQMKHKQHSHLQLKFKSIQSYTLRACKMNLALGSFVFESSKGLSSVQSLSCVWLSANPWTTAHQASLSITNSWSKNIYSTFKKKTIWSLGAQILTWKLPVGAILTVFGKDTDKVIYVKVLHETI